MREVGIDRTPVGVRVELAEQRSAHLHEGGHAVPCDVEAAEQLTSRWLHGLLEAHQVHLRRIGSIDVGAVLDGLRVWRKRLHQQIEERDPRLAIECVVQREGLGGDLQTRHLAALGQERVTERDRPLRFNRSRRAFRGPSGQRAQNPGQQVVRCP